MSVTEAQQSAVALLIDAAWLAMYVSDRGGSVDDINRAGHAAKNALDAAREADLTFRNTVASTESPER